MPLVPTESASRLIPPNIRNTPPLPKAVIAFTGRNTGKSSCIEACQPRVSAVSAAVFVRSQSTGRPHAASTASRYSAIGVNPAAARSEPRRAASSTGQRRKAPPSHSDPLQTSASRSAAAICHASACDRTPMHHPPFRSYLSPQPFRPSADSVQYPPAKHC